MNLRKNRYINYNYMIISFRNYNNSIKYHIKQQYQFMDRISQENQHLLQD